MPGKRIRRIAWFALLLGAPWGLYYLLFHVVQPVASLDTNQLLLPALSLVFVVLTLGLAGVLIRNLVKLILERRRGILGSKLRIKLVFSFLALVLLPAIILFYGSAAVIKQTVEAIARTPVEYLEHGGDIVAQWNEHFRDLSLRRAESLADAIRRNELLQPERRADLASLLERHLHAEQLAMVHVVAGDRRVASAEAALHPRIVAEMERLVDALSAEAGAAGQADTGFARLEEGLLAYAAVPLRQAAEPDQAWTVVSVATLLPQGIAGYLQSIDSAVQDYKRFRQERRNLVRRFVTLIGFVFLATLFVATWFGWYVARRITEPIQEVAAAAREIAAGNMDVRVHSQVGDEMAMLVDAFNEMAGELQENREVITRSTADLRRSNQALAERRRYIEILVANLSTAVISIDPSGRVTTANPAVGKILAVPLATADDAVEVLREHGLEPLSDLLALALRSERDSIRRDLELPSTAPTQHVSVQISPLRGRSNEDLGSLIMVEDLSDLLRAQKALAWQDVARRIAHEIKNPLTPIQLAAQRLRKKFFAGADDLDEVLLEATASIEHEVQGLMQLLDEFSRFARMPQIDPKPVQLVGVIESVLALYKGLSGIEWQVELDREMGPVSVDAQQMRRVLINLIDNAVAAMNEQGTICIRARALGGEESVRIEVVDSGPGIPPDDRDKMFAPYFSTKKRGTGIGLAIVHKVITDHRGTIRVEDNLPHGARFVIEIPARSGPVTQ